MIYLSRQGQGVLASRQDIARQADIPAHFLAKIAQDLAKAGLIEIRQGARAGFLLSKNPTAINLLEVVETMIGDGPYPKQLLEPKSLIRPPHETICNEHPA